MNSRAPDIAIYLRTYLCAAFRCSGVNSLHVRAFAKLGWTAVTLNSSDTTSRQLSNGRELKMYS